MCAGRNFRLAFFLFTGQWAEKRSLLPYVFPSFLPSLFSLFHSSFLLLTYLLTFFLAKYAHGILLHISFYLAGVYKMHGA